MLESGSIVIGLVLFGIGMAAGFALGVGGGGSRRRERELREALRSERAHLESYRSQVTTHMDQTAHLFRDLTNQHAALYHHLAHGARELSPRPDRLGGQIFGRTLIEFASDPPRPQLEEEAPARDDPTPAAEGPPEVRDA